MFLDRKENIPGKTNPLEFTINTDSVARIVNSISPTVVQNIIELATSTNKKVRLYAYPDGKISFTLNCYFDNPDWKKDISGQTAYNYTFTSGELLIRTRMSDTDWSDAGWADTPVSGTMAVGGDLSGNLPNPTLVTTGVTANMYPTTGSIPTLTIDAKGRITSASSTTDGSALVNTDAAKLRGTGIDNTAPTSGQILKYDGTNWKPSTSTDRITITMATLTPPAAAFYAGHFIGPAGGNTSSPSFFGYGGCGFVTAPITGTLTNFIYSHADVCGVDFTVDLYIAPGGVLALIAYSGFSLTIPANTYSKIELSTLSINAGDLLVFYNSNLSLGYTPSALTITADILK